MCARSVKLRRRKYCAGLPKDVSDGAKFATLALQFDDLIILCVRRHEPLVGIRVAQLPSGAQTAGRSAKLPRLIDRLRRQWYRRHWSVEARKLRDRGIHLDRHGDSSGRPRAHPFGVFSSADARRFNQTAETPARAADLPCLMELGSRCCEKNFADKRSSIPLPPNNLRMSWLGTKVFQLKPCLSAGRNRQSTWKEFAPPCDHSWKNTVGLRGARQ